MEQTTNTIGVKDWLSAANNRLSIFPSIRPEMLTLSGWRHRVPAMDIFDDARTKDNQTISRLPTENVKDQLARFLAKKFSSRSDIEAVYILAMDEEIDLWTITHEDSEDVRSKLYEAELEMMQAFENYQFEFHIYARRDADPEEFIKSNPSIQRVYP